MKNYKLENAVQRKKEAGETFYLPCNDHIAQLRVGSVVKLIFIHPNGGKDERMWVEINRVGKKGDFSGVLVNQPQGIKNLDYGDNIDFKNENIIDIHDEK